MNRLEIMSVCSFVLFVLAGCSGASASGEFTLVAIDLDANPVAVGPGQYDLEAQEFDTHEGGDIVLTEGSGSARFVTLYPPNEAKASYFGTEPPDIEDCRGVLAETLGGAVPQIAVGSYICVLTTEGNIARLLIEDLDSGFPAEMDLSYTLWLIDSE